MFAAREPNTPWQRLVEEGFTMDTNRKLITNPKILAALVVFIVAGALILFALSRSGLPSSGENTPMPYTVDTGPQGTGEGNDEGSGDEYGIEVDVSEGQAQLQTPVPRPVATGEPLSPQEVEDIFSRLPALPLSPAEQTEFNYPVILLPPPRPGVTIKESFPPSEFEPTPQVGSPGPLEVLRFAPEGEIPIAPFVSITFNQPMVPLGTLGDLAAEDVPVQVDPPLPGTWRWMGTRTLTFEYDSELIDRLPKATAYTVTVPAGTKSVSGGVLAESVSWTFSTPPPVVTTFYPQNIPQPLQPLMFVAFDQRIDPDAVLKTIQVYAGNKQVDLVLATSSEIEKDRTGQPICRECPGQPLAGLQSALPVSRGYFHLRHHRTRNTFCGRAARHHLRTVFWILDLCTFESCGARMLLV